MCNWSANGYRLPTEAEWEKAARGGVSREELPVGQDTITPQPGELLQFIHPYAYDVSPTRGYHPTYAVGGYPYSSPVGSFAPNGYGLYDMAGNMWEWCWDWYGSYAAGSQTNPRGPSSGYDKILRGGAWSGGNTGYSCRVAAQGCAWPISADSYHHTGLWGFRLARSSVP